MAGDPLKYMRVGDPPGIDVDAWNALVDGVRPHGKRPVQDNLPPPFPLNHDAADILIRNDSGADRNRFDILGLSSPLITHSTDSTALNECLRRVALSGIEPASGHVRKFCVLQEPIGDGQIGRAKITGYTFVYTNGSGSESFAKAVAAQYSALDLASDGSAEILWREGTGSSKLALVRLGAGEAGGGGGGFNMATRRLTDVYHIAANDCYAIAIGITNLALLPNGFGEDGWIWATPFTVIDGVINRLRVFHPASNTSSIEYRVGIYDDDNFFPGSPLFDSGVFDLSDDPATFNDITCSLSTSKDSLYWAVTQIDQFTPTGLEPSFVTIDNAEFRTGMLGWTDAQITDNLNVDLFGRPTSGFVKEMGALAALPDPFPVDASRLPLDYTANATVPTFFIRYA